MARRPRIEIPGYYHIINRGVARSVIFKVPADYAYFEELMCFHLKSYGIVLHNYCLMPNHYHLLIEIRDENLSRFMRQLNMHYAIYFNKKYNRTGHLWQGRFKSWYVSSEAYLYTLMCYIEQNPLKAHMVNELEDYPYGSYAYFLKEVIPECLKDAWIVKNHGRDHAAIVEMLNSQADSSTLTELKKASSLIEASNVDKKPNMERLQKMFGEEQTTQQRNRQIVKAYEEGYSQHMIAKVLELNQATVQRIIKRTQG